VQARVLDGDRELAGEGDQQRLLPLAIRSRALLEDGQCADDLLVGDERDEESPPDAALLQGRLEPRQPWIGAHVRDEQVAPAAKRPQRELEQALGHIGRLGTG
jgi:hypothetical protein